MMVMLVTPTIPGCDPAGPAEPAASPRAAEAGAGARAPRRGRMIAGERVARIPIWPDAGTIDTAVRERMPAATRAAIDRAPVPVLAPADATLAADTQVFSQATGYALATRAGEVTITVQASRVATLLPHVGAADGDTRLRGVLGWVSSNDGIGTAAWIEHGTAYSLDLECFDADGPACAPAAVRAAVESLVYVGGEGGR